MKQILFVKGKIILVKFKLLFKLLLLLLFNIFSMFLLLIEILVKNEF